MHSKEMWKNISGFIKHHNMTTEKEQLSPKAEILKIGTITTTATPGIWCMEGWEFGPCLIAHELDKEKGGEKWMGYTVDELRDISAEEQLRIALKKYPRQGLIKK